MIIYINTANPMVVHCALVIDGELAHELVQDAQYVQAQKIIPIIQELLMYTKRSLSDTIGICVVKGPGPFTATRVGVTTANALSYGLGVPIVGIELNEQKQSLAETVETAISAAKQTIVQPIYNQDPNITKPQKH